ncbi:MAG: phosphate acyltransferase [Fermentimonas sp.]|jgi:phosphate butyryltransferase
MRNDLSGLIGKARERGKRTIAIAAAEDEFVLKAVQDAVTAEVVTPLLVGNRREIEKFARRIDFDLSHIDILDNREGTLAGCVVEIPSRLISR